MDEDKIYSYVKLYKNIADKYKILLDERDFSQIYQLVLLVFKLDDLYDVFSLAPPIQTELAKIEERMIFLMPNNNPIGLQAIALCFEAMKEESLLTFIIDHLSFIN